MAKGTEERVVTQAVAPARRLWLGPLLATALAGIVLAFLLFPGSLLCDRAGFLCAAAYEPVPDPPRPDPALQAQIVQGLEQRVTALQSRLAEPASCTIDDYRAPADGAETGKVLSKPALLTIADRNTFLIVARDGASGVSAGTGFLINGRQLVTNRHVVDKADAGGVVAYNAAAGRFRGRIVASSVGSQPGQDDIAVIELERPTGGAGLALSTSASRGEPVVAAGYPAQVLDGNEVYRRLLEGGTGRASIPPVPSTGILMARQGEGATEVLVHSALIYPGNSGGPLLDECGRAVGVNTFISYRTDLPSAAYFALGAQRLAIFLKQKNVEFRVSAAACSATAGAPAPAGR